jgi:hypothetical protein
MARIKYGSLVTEIAGSIGGSTFQRSAYGNTLRNKPVPIRSTSQAQLSIRQYMKQVHDAWAALDSDERIQWQQFTTFANPKIKHDHGVTMSGHALYLKYQVSRLINGLSILETIQYIPMPTWYYPTSIIQESPNLYVITNAAPETPLGDIFLIIKLSAPRSASQRFKPGGLRHVTTVWSDAYEASVGVSYKAIFGAIPPIGVYLHYSYQAFSTLSPIFSNLRTGSLIVEEL